MSPWSATVLVSAVSSPGLWKPHAQSVKARVSAARPLTIFIRIEFATRSHSITLLRGVWDAYVRAMRKLCGRRVSLLPLVCGAATAEARRVLPFGSVRAAGQVAARLPLPPRRPRGAARPLLDLARRARRRCG